MKSIKKITAEETYFIRKEVLRKGIKKPYQFDGDLDKETFHLGAFYNNELVGVATFMNRDCNLLKGNQYQLRGMATLTKVRGFGLGNLLIENATKLLIEKGNDVLWCNAREVALNFYLKNGFEISGKSFEIDEIGTHYRMYKHLIKVH